ncbi:MAG: PhzF family phenazine biosynthesis protein [Gemmatimonadetes bacterium]|nr:PhzF family phenazine biosynthesis protein [Gemmatimonadota bacterium]
MSCRMVQVDAFTDRPFAGNPAAVCILAQPAPHPWMQAVAREMNLSETAFLHPEGQAYRLRWFTPTTEVELCGHATLASAHVLWEDGHLPADQTARFHTLSGPLAARRSGEGIEMDFPALPPEPAAAPPGLAAALGANAVAIARSRFDYLIELESAAQIRNLQPDFSRLRNIPARGIIVTARADTPEYDFISRFFAPAAGVDEDPVTGSAHCSLGPYWSARLGKTELAAYQASARGGSLRLTLHHQRIALWGKAVTVLHAQLLA